MAMQDGDGPWYRLVPIDGATTYRINLRSQRGAIAIKGTWLDIYYATPAQLEEYLRTFEGRCDGRMVQGEVSGLKTSDSLLVTLGSSNSAYFVPATPLPIYVHPNEPDPLDLVAMAWNADDVRYILRTGLTVSEGSILAPMDFASAESFASAQATLTVTDIRSRGTAYVAFGQGAFISPPANFTGPSTYHGFPLSHLPEGRAQTLVVEDLDTLRHERRTTQLTFRAVENRTLTIGPSMPDPLIVVRLDGGLAFPSAEVASQPEYGRWASASFWSEGADNYTSVLVTAEYLGGTPATWVVAVPNLTRLPGFELAWAFPAGTPIRHSVAVGGGTLPWPASFFTSSTSRPEGDELRYVSRSGVTQ